MRLVYSVLAVLFIFVDTSAAQDFRRLAGKWNNDQTGENIVVVSDPLGGWEFWASDYGQARISPTSVQGSNIKVEGRELSCFYYATLTAGNKMNWQLRAGNPNCLSRIFTRAE
jgi:hypothetical protein